MGGLKVDIRKFARDVAQSLPVLKPSELKILEKASETNKPEEFFSNLEWLLNKHGLLDQFRDQLQESRKENFNKIQDEFMIYFTVRHMDRWSEYKTASPLDCPHCGEAIYLLGRKELATILEWDPRHIDTYRKRGHVPDPDFILSAGPVWLASNPKLQEFIKKHNKELD